MIGVGSMMHAISSLKMNRRNKTNVFEKDNPNKREKKPFELKKASKEKLLVLKTERENLQKVENTRRVLALAFVLVIIVIIGFAL